MFFIKLVLMVRVLLLLSVMGVFALGEVHAMDSASIPPKKATSCKKHLIEEERNFFSPIRRDIVMLSYNDDIKTKNHVSSPEIRNVYRRHDKPYWVGKVNFMGKTVLQISIDPSIKVLSEDGTWQTNAERMHNGTAPILIEVFKPDLHDQKLKKAEIREILKQQKSRRIELHHPAQGEKDSLLEMTHSAHMGKNARMIIKQNLNDNVPIIVASSLEKEEAQRLKAEDEEIKTNILHYRKGKSRIPRNAHHTFVGLYWPYRISEIMKNAESYFLRKTNLFSHRWEKEIVLMIEKFDMEKEKDPLREIMLLIDSYGVDKENLFSSTKNRVTIFSPQAKMKLLSPPNSPFKVRKKAPVVL